MGWILVVTVVEVTLQGPELPRRGGNQFQVDDLNADERARGETKGKETVSEMLRLYQ